MATNATLDPPVETAVSDELPPRLLWLSFVIQEHLASTAEVFGLTPQQTWAMRILDEPRAMGELATVMRCDASNITGIVDRLEQRGLIERRSDAQDRRVRRLVVTPAGRSLRRRFERRLADQMPGVGALTEPERRRLLHLVRKLTPDPAC